LKLSGVVPDVAEQAQSTPRQTNRARVVTTLNSYARVMPGAEAKAVEAIAKRLGKAESGIS
jgi:hypothetical protein